MDQSFNDLQQTRAAFKPPVELMGRIPLACTYLLLVGAALAPIFFVTVPTLVDYPNHLARIHILANLHEIPALAENYTTEWTLIPNLGIDLLLPVIARAVGTYDAGRIFISVVILSNIIGVLFLRRVLYGRLDSLPIFFFLFIYSHLFFWGFLNYFFGIGLYLIFFASWIVLRDDLRLWKVGLFSLLSVILFFIHFMALGVYSLSILAYEAWRFVDRRDQPRRVRLAALALLQFFPVGLLTVLWVGGVTGGGGGNGDLIYGDLKWKIFALFSPAVYSGRWFDLVTLVTAFGAILWMVGERPFSISKPLRWPLMVLCIAAIAMPHESRSIEVWGIDLRLPPVIMMLFIGAARLKETHRARYRTAVYAACALVVLRAIDVALLWTGMDARFHEFRQAVQKIEPGASLLVVQDREDLPDNLKPLGDRPFWHMASLAIIERSVFTPLQFTGHMALRATEKRHPIDTPVGTPVSREGLKEAETLNNNELARNYATTKYLRTYWGEWQKNFDYVLVVRFANTENPSPGYLKPIVNGSFFDIYGVIKPAPT